MHTCMHGLCIFVQTMHAVYLFCIGNLHGLYPNFGEHYILQNDSHLVLAKFKFGDLRAQCYRRACTLRLN